jgi:CRISPR/Cas system-associated exonuclease Cas4 (RecB family)
MFYSKRKDGRELFPHPFWDEISNVLDSSNLLRRCGDLCADVCWKLAERTATLQKVQKASPALVREAYEIPPNLAAPQNLSYSQMSTLMGCPLKWAFQYHSGLRTSDTLALPTGNRMIGNLCHRIVQEIYNAPDRQIAPKDAADEAGRLYDELLPSMASELALEGKELENKRTRRTVVHAVRQLAESIERLGLSVEKSEEKLESSTNGVPFVGYADLLLRTGAGEAFVLDMKWAGSGKYKKEELKDGRALQLASYAWLLKSIEPGAEKPVHAGYFMLAQGELLSDSPLLGEDALLSRRSLDETWVSASEGWSGEIKKLNDGVAEARGIMEDRNGVPANADDSVYVAPPCAFCDFSVLCGRSGGQP